MPIDPFGLLGGSAIANVVTDSLSPRPCWP